MNQKATSYKVVEPGHVYELSRAGGRVTFATQGLGGSETPGTSNEELLGVAIDRMRFLQQHCPSEENSHILVRLNECQNLLSNRKIRIRKALEVEAQRQAEEREAIEAEDKKMAAQRQAVIDQAAKDKAKEEAAAIEGDEVKAIESKIEETPPGKAVDLSDAGTETPANPTPKE